MLDLVVLGLFGHCAKTMAEEFVDSSGFVRYFGFQVGFFLL